MSAFARLLSVQGHRVSGCDAHVTELTARLSKEGIPVAPEHPTPDPTGLDAIARTEWSSEPHLESA